MDVDEQIPVPTTMSAIGTLRRPLDHEPELEGLTASAGVIADYEDQYLDELTSAVEDSLRSIRQLVISRIRAKATAVKPIAASPGEFANPWHDEIGRFAPKGTGRKVAVKTWGTDRKVTVAKMVNGHTHSVTTATGDTIVLRDYSDTLSSMPDGQQAISDVLNGLADAHDLSPGMKPPTVIVKPYEQQIADLAAMSGVSHVKLAARLATAGAWVLNYPDAENPAPGMVFINPEWLQAESFLPDQEMPGMLYVGPSRWKAMHEYGHLRVNAGLDNAEKLEPLFDSLGGQYGMEGMSRYGRSDPIEAHAEAFAEFVTRGGTLDTTRYGETVGVYADEFGWRDDLAPVERREEQIAAAAGSGRGAWPAVIADSPDGPIYIWPDGTIEEIPVEQALVAANPWHDEIGRFAPKGTGRKFGASQQELAALFDPVRPLVDVLEAAGAKTYLVGGSVRDRLLGIDAKDIDIEVHDIPVEETIALLEQQGARIDEVGASFGVLNVTFDGETHDFSFPRTEVKTGEGHTGFDVTVDPYLGIERALSRRDFTMNALAVDSDGNLIDPYNGVADLQDGILRHVSTAFSEDPLRILRGVQFAARMGLRFDPTTAHLARQLLPELETMHPDRVWGEFQKLGGKGISMEAAVNALRDVGLDSRYGDVHFDHEPNLDGVFGDHRAAVALTSIGVDPRQIGAPNTVSRQMRDIQTALDFQGGPADSRSLARSLKYGTFADAERIAGPNHNVDPRVLHGPLPQLITGNDVMARGIRGPAIGEVLRAVQRAQDNDVIATREDALSWLDEHTQLTTLVAANPWHDEIGRFAPKGRGRRLGPGILNDDPAKYDRVDLSDIEAVRSSIHDFTAEMNHKLRTSYGERFTLAVSNLSANPEQTITDFTLTNGDGEQIGTMARQFDVGDNDAYAAGLHLDSEYQGMGLGTVLQEGFEDWAASQGLDVIGVHAVDVGRYAWMRAGYDWDPRARENFTVIGGRLRTYAKRQRDPDKRTRLEQASQQFLNNAGRAGHDWDEDLPTPYEISTMLSREEILDGFPTWNGVKPLRTLALAAAPNVSREARLEPVRRAWKIWARQYPAAAEGYEVDPEAEAAWESLMADPDMLMLDDPDGLVAAGPFDLDDFNVMTAEEWAVAFDVEAADIIGDVVVDAATGQPLRPGLNVTDRVITELIDRHIGRLQGLGPVVQASLRDALELAISNQMSIDDVVREIQATGPLGETAARAIARTELTAATNGGMLTGWKRDGYPFKMWRSLHDERVRHAHLDADRQVVPTEQEFEVGGYRAQYPGDPRLPVGLRINCLPGWVPVTADHVEAGYRRWYSGEVIEVVTAGGHMLTATPNHPVMTADGPVAIGCLVEGSRLLCGPEVRRVAGAGPDVEHRPAPIGEIFDALQDALLAERVAVVPMDFHGDGFDAEVEVVLADPLLRHDSKAQSTKVSLELGFAPAHSVERSLMSGGSSPQPGGRIGLAPPGGMSAANQGKSTIGVETGHAQELLLGAVPDGHPLSAQPVDDGHPGDTKRASEDLRWLASHVTLDEIVRIRRYEWSGYVHNLQTASSFYQADGIIVCNCRCYMDRIGESGQTIGTRLADATRAELYRLAQELQIPGRSKMLKEDLFQAIDRFRSGFGFTSLEEMNRAQLLIRARAAGIVGRSRMSKAELMIRLRALSTGRNRDRWLIDAGHGTREQLEAVQAQLRADIAALTTPPITAAGPPPSAEKTASLRAAVFRRYGGKETGTALCVGCGARLHWSANTRWEQMTLIRLDPNVAWSARNAAPVCLADAAKLATKPMVASAGQFANPWHDEIGQFAPKGTGTNFANIARRADQAEAAGSEISELDVAKADQLAARLRDFAAEMGYDFEADPGVKLTKAALSQRHGRGTMNGLVATNPDGHVLGAIAYNKHPGDYHIEFLGSTGLVKGVGSQLVIPVMRQAAADGAQVSLQVASGSDSAGPFWESMGFARSGHSTMSPDDVKSWVANLDREREDALVAAGPATGWDPDDDRWAAHAIELGLLTIVASAGQFANPWHDQIGRFAPKGTGTKSMGAVTSVSEAEFDAAIEALARSDSESTWGTPGSAEHLAFLDAIKNGEGAYSDPAVVEAWDWYANLNGYKDVGKHLRAGKEVDAMTKAKIESMQKAFTPPPARPLPDAPMFRGETEADRPKLGPTLKPGDTFTDNGFASVSENSRSAQMFANYESGLNDGPSRVIYVIRKTEATANTPVVAVDGREQEWALPAGSQFRVGNIIEHARQGYSLYNDAPSDDEMGNVVDRIIELEWIA